jgi:branched-chain amino acid transport system ATP-binding protein
VTLLAVEDLGKAFAGFKAVDGVSFEVAVGELVALIGPNGAGKTTTFNLINGQLVPDRGRVVLAGRDVTGLSAREQWRLGVGRTFQIAAAFASMSVAENIRVALLSRQRELGFIADAARRHQAAIEEILSEIGMADAVEQTCGALSYGDLKRVELALALVNRPRLLLMDEPTAGMALAERVRLMALVTRVARERGTAVLFTEHDMDVVFAHARRIIVMNRGRIIADDGPEAVRRNAEVREVYLGHAPNGAD